jgi:hypothetical protein
MVEGRGVICNYCLRQAEHGRQCRECFEYMESLLTSDSQTDRDYGWQLAGLAVAGARHRGGLYRAA